MFENIEKTTKVIAAAAASISVVGGGWTLTEKSGLFHKEILEWAPEHFNISNGRADGGFRVVAARRKARDDCTVEDFRIGIIDQDGVAHEAKPSFSRVSVPASDKVHRFGYRISLMTPDEVAPGKAQLVAQIRYKCPEGDKTISYPTHDNLTFIIEEAK
jgi:hypothetical protein